MSDRVRIGCCANPAEATLLRAFFDAHDVSVTINGEQHAAMLGGLGGAFLSLEIAVDGADAEKARELLAEFRGAAPAMDEEDDEDEVDDLSFKLERRKRIAIAIMLACFITFGTGHLSAGAFKRAFALAVFEMLAIREVIVHGAWPGAAMCVAAVLLDMLGSVHVIRARFAHRIPPATLRK